MRKIQNAFIAILLLSFSCADHNIGPKNTCSVRDPAKNLLWLKAEITWREQHANELSKYFFIQHGKYKGESVFIYNNCCPMCDTIIQIFNCEGEELFIHDDHEIKDLEILWSPEDFECKL